MTQDAETQYLHRVTMETNEQFFLRIALLTEPGIPVTPVFSCQPGEALFIRCSK